MIIQKAVKLAMEVFEQKMKDFAGKADTRALTADLALDFSAALKDAFSKAGQKAYQRFIESYDIQRPILQVDGRKLRWKMASPKDFLTPFGTMQITRSWYRRTRSVSGHFSTSQPSKVRSRHSKLME